MSRILSLLVAAVLLIGGAMFWSMRESTPGSTGFSVANAQETTRSDNQDDTSKVDTSGVIDMSMGNPDAKVTVIEYASFTCPHCARFHQTVLKELKKNYIDPGKINFVFREVYFDRFGLWAGMVARCGGPVRYFGIADLIFEQQRDWIAGGDPQKITVNLRKIGKTAGLTDDQLDQCMADKEMARAMVEVYKENATADGINATPSFVINGKKYSNMSYEDFAAILDEKLAE